MKNILMTGCCGAIGSYLIHNLSKCYNIVGVDNMLTQRYCSLRNSPSNFKFVEKSFIDLTEDDLRGIDIVYHSAAICDASSSFKNIEEVEKINIEQTKQFIDFILRKTEVKLFIFPSSTSVYGINTKEEVSEDNDKFILPQSPYAISKLEIEKYLKDVKKIYGLERFNYVVLRYGTIFGLSEGIRYHTAINSFCYSAYKKERLNIWRENYEMFRPYLALSDACHSVELILKNENSWNQTYNVLTGNYKLCDIVKMIREIKEIDIKFVDSPLLNQYSYFVNCDKIKSLGFSPKGNLRKEIKKTIQNLRR